MTISGVTDVGIGPGGCTTIQICTPLIPPSPLPRIINAYQDIAEMCADFRKKLAATESQLSSVVRSRLDGVKRARDLIDDNANQISRLHEQFAKMEE